MNNHLQLGNSRFARITFVVLLITILVQAPQTVSAQLTAAKGQINIIGPSGSSLFGKSVTVLPNGNFVVTDPNYREGVTSNVGAVYLYNGSTKALVSTLKGSFADDKVGSSGITILQDGNFLVNSPYWNNNGAIAAGAVTWCNAATGCPASISAANSLVGSHTSDRIGSQWVLTFSDDIYIIQSPLWDNGAVVDAGALTICRTTSVCNGTISPSNSLLGSSAGDNVGYSSIYSLPNSRWAIATQNWDNGGVMDTGAVTFCASVETCRGLVSISNSLVGSTTNDRIGWITVLNDGDYLVHSAWDNGLTVDAGAVTYCSGSGGCVGAVSSSNSLVGGHNNDQIGSGAVLQLENGRYVLLSPEWDRGGISNAGAVTWCSTNGCTGYISESNSLVGSTANDKIGTNGIRLYSGGDYLILSPEWDDDGPIANVGAATWCSGASGCQGEITSANSLIGSQADDGQGMSAIASSDVNNFMVMFPNLDYESIANAGAVVWCPADSGCLGEITQANSLRGSHNNDQVGIFGTEMGGGKYIVDSYNWNGTAAGTGAFTFCQQLAGCPGIVSQSNSLVGSTAGDHVGGGSFTWDNDGNLLISHNSWNYGGAANAGALTFCKNSATCVGPVSADNSLIGTQENDQVGENFQFLPNGNYVSTSTGWHGVGSVTFCSGASGCAGPISTSNSLIGSSADDQVGMYLRVLENGNYVVGSPNWDNGGVSEVGAVTFCSATTGCQGNVSVANSMVGASNQDYMGNQAIDALPNNDYLVFSPYWDNNGTPNAGNLTWCDGSTGCRGSASIFPRSVRGENVDGGFSMNYAYDPINQQVVVGRPTENTVTVLDITIENSIFLPILKR